MNKTALDTIKKRLPEIEIEHNVKILYAVESGSRAWGFESVDSDYDIRFIYKHKTNWYLNILPKREVIEYPIINLFDYSGWDLRKTFFLLNKSNPVLFEWLQSPIIYIKNIKAYALLKEAAKNYFSPISAIYHYLHMAAGNFRSYLKDDEVKAKKYFYVLRPLFACMWVETRNESPPMEFERLINDLDLDKNLVSEIKILLEKKRKGMELGVQKKIPVINDFIAEKINYYENHTISFNPKKKPDSRLLDEFFIRILNDTD